MKQFALLNQHGLDTATMVELSFKEHKKILAGLAQGKSLVDLLCMNANDPYFQTLHILCQSLSFDKAIQCADALDTVQSELKTKVLRALAYPTFLFLFSYGLILFFSRTIIPSLLTYGSSSTSMGLVRALQIGYTIVFFLLLLLIFGFVCRHWIPFIQKKIDMLPLFSSIDHYSFSLIWTALLENGCSTQSCIQMMTKMKTTKIMAMHIQSGLEMGLSLWDALHNEFGKDPLFMRCIQLGMHSSNLLHILPIYQSRVLYEIQTRIKKYILFVQLFAYTSVAILVLVFYQVLLLPLNLLQTF